MACDLRVVCRRPARAIKTSTSIRRTLTEFLTTPGRQSATLQESAHRPWPLPDDSWVMGQTWHDLLFAHWRVPSAELRTHVPAVLPLDTHDGNAWVGVTPFCLAGLRARRTYPLPLVSIFPELNVRTYVTVAGKPGIFFFSLDAGSALAVAAARRFYHLPYFWAAMSVRTDNGFVEYQSRRRGEPARLFSGRYRPTGPAVHAEPGTLEHFLTERYCLYTVADGRLWRAEIHHAPRPLQPAQAELRANGMAPEGLDLPGEPLLHFAGRQDVLIWPLEAVDL
jgi:uncharacterized protein